MSKLIDLGSTLWHLAALGMGLWAMLDAAHAPTLAQVPTQDLMWMGFGLLVNAKAAKDLA